MAGRGSADLEQRVARAAQAALDDHDYVSAIDVLTGLGWLDHSALQRWRQGRAGSLEQVTQACRTHWVSPVLSERKRQRLAEQHGRPPDPMVSQPLRDFTCDRCGRPDGLLMRPPGQLGRAQPQQPRRPPTRTMSDAWSWSVAAAGPRCDHVR